MKNSLVFPLLAGLILAACVCKEHPTPQTGKCYAPDTSTFRYYPTEILVSPFNNLYHRWKWVSSSGGITGKGEEPRFQHLIFKPVGRYEVLLNNQVAEFGKIRILSASGEVPFRIQLETDPESQQVLFDMEKSVSITETQLELEAPCCDRISYQLEKDE